MYKSSGCGPVALNSIISSIHYIEMEEIREIGVINFSIGQAIQAEYGNSSDGRTRIDLLDAKGDIVLHFTARFDQKALVLNTRINGDWGKEERPSGYDFSPEKNYTVEFLATEDYVSISLDGKPFHDYKHRLPITSVVKVHYETSGTPGKLQYLAVKF